MSYEGIMWGPSMRGYLADNKARISGCEKSLASLKNQDGEFARDHRLLLALYREFGDVIDRHIKAADEAVLVFPANEVVGGAR
jgi:hypothetical protein